jgi:hypothetical protein
MPAPRRPRELDERDDPVRVDPVDRVVGRLGAVPRVAVVAPEVAAGMAVDGTEPGGAGAVPQTSQ